MSFVRYGSKRIAIIGAGIAGLHLGLRLRQLGIACTIITDRTPAQIAAGRLANTVVHWPATLQRERVLKVHHWPAEQFGFKLLHNIVHASEPVDVRCFATVPARAVDYRIYLPRLMEDFTERGGRLEIRALDVNDIGQIAGDSDLVVVATPGNGFANLFPRDAANSPYAYPQRTWLAGLFTGFRPTEERGATLSVAPDHGEAVQFPLLSRSGLVTALLISAREAVDLEVLRALSIRGSRAGFRAALLATLEQFHPTIYSRIDTARLDLLGPDDLVRAAVTPIVRQAVADLGGGKYAVALGDVHVTVDPLLGQGANIGSYSAFVLADAIEEAKSFDFAFCHDVERARAARVLGAARWTNAFLQPPDEARVELLVAMSRNRQLAQEYFDNFSRPDRQWDRVGSPESISAWLRETQTHPAPRMPMAAGP